MNLIRCWHCLHLFTKGATVTQMQLLSGVVLVHHECFNDAAKVAGTILMHLLTVTPPKGQA